MTEARAQAKEGLANQNLVANMHPGSQDLCPEGGERVGVMSVLTSLTSGNRARGGDGEGPREAQETVAGAPGGGRPPFVSAVGLSEVADDVGGGPDRQVQRGARSVHHVDPRKAPDQYRLPRRGSEGARPQPALRQQALHLRLPSAVFNQRSCLTGS